MSAVRLSAELLETRVNEPNNLKLIRAVRQSAVRMGVLIEDVLDFARGELGGGIPIKPVVTDTLQEQFEAVLTGSGSCTLAR
ncbi:histidine kinase dimerization/phospho-acceptor domain-containing protein [Pseudomonas sp. OHS18]|uniref:histidine kinase dimerization/phospho-acceptor domain-containing protein n=1 Tax=Pseudomonas sp. OHS18 TaxID=3399679 RepID=UPI003A8B3832